MGVSLLACRRRQDGVFCACEYSIGGGSSRAQMTSQSIMNNCCFATSYIHSFVARSSLRIEANLQQPPSKIKRKHHHNLSIDEYACLRVGPSSDKRA
jgi:hypothetical protein